YQLALLGIEPPKLPDRLSPGQAAQLSEVIEFLHMHMRGIVNAASPDPRDKNVKLSSDQWQKVLDAQAFLAEYLRKIGNPS
ncbi:MAG: FHA domain-containing protein, partial [Planctomycetota bacterium]